ncbi:EAL domain-containing protein [Marinomonas sp. C1424]|uniref:cyclic-guanylate-specific phosphodiesterase n=2 Tax=Marinomonas transparens TaxID=2795388 RepID=A0A934JHR1_9GAMM|nr:EAL domain-containing protein [Marinomonas transparens]
MGLYFSFLVKPPSIPSEHVDAYRAQQFRAIAAQLPLACFSTYLMAFIGFFFAWKGSHSLLLISFGLALILVATSELLLWWQYLIQDKTKKVTKTVVRVLAIELGLTGLLYAFITIYLFSIFSDHERIMLISGIAGFISCGGWIFASMPLVGLTWTISLCAGLIIGLVFLFGDTYILLEAMIAFYCLLLCGVTLVSYHKFLDNLMTQSEIEKQRQLVELLLNDFEEKASDWLWETDKYGCLRYVSLRLMEATGSDTETLIIRSYPNIIKGLLSASDDKDSKYLDTFMTSLGSKKDFNGIIVPVKVDDTTRWWSFSAKPLFDNDKQFNGWRGVTSDITDAYLHEKQMIRQANSDTLTGIGNRHFFNEKLTSFFNENTTNQPCALLLLDLDNFKMVNDSFGHATGDALLIEVTNRLKDTIPQNATLARLGGDEFAIILSSDLEQSAVTALCDKLQQTLTQPWRHGENHLEIHASIGIAFTQDNIHNTEKLLRASDLALYAAKDSGRDTIRFFTPDMEILANNKRQILNDIRQALTNNEFSLHYQPQIDLATNTIKGFEALVRWQHPKRGFILPSEFISLAEESGLIVPLGNWVLKQACLDAQKWPSHIYVAVNASAVQVERSDFLAEVKKIMTQTQLPYHRLEIELTESTLMANDNAALSLLNELKAIGVQIALDDFGTGFSSLSYLRTFPLDKIKIDRSFISLLESDDKAYAIIRTITQLAQTLHLSTTAEGIESETQCSILAGLSVNYGQGYLYAKPMSAEETLIFINNYQA